MAQRPLIRTSYNEALAEELAYPVGAQLLSQHLVGVPQFWQLAVNFARCPLASASEFQQIISTGAEYYILDVGWSQDSWSIGVFPVLRGRQQAATNALVSSGLPMLRRWLTVHDRPIATEPNHCQIMFAPHSATVYLREPQTG